MAESPASEASQEPESGDESNAAHPPAKAPAVKDKECQYCHQQFTSSSLGRHLDQFISKKKPDGVHDVEEIRRLRGGITRRTARSSKRDRDKNDHEDTRSSQASPGPSIGPQPGTLISSAIELNRVPPGGMHVRLNRLNWQATGVITDPTTLDSPATAAAAAAPPTPAVVSSPSGTKRSFSVYAQDLNPASNAENTRALELALREVLDSLRAATKHASPKPSPFKFDIQTQTFPSLCLKLLSAPATLFQASPFSTPQSIPINPPGPDQLAPLRQTLTSTIDHWKWHTLRLAQPTTSNIAEEADFLTRSAAQWTESTLSHLETCFQNWMAHPIEIRNLLWQVELLRAYNTEQQKVQETEERLERLQQEASQLQQQVEYLSRCQWPREMALWPPERRTFGASMREELRLINLNKVPAGSVGSDAPEEMVSLPSENVNTRQGDKWDFDKLVNKWKAHVREDKNRRMPQSLVSVDGNGGGVGGPPAVKVAELKKTQSEPGVNGLSNGQSPTSTDERRKGGRNQKANISIISDL
ncbi:uncharacterized protein PV07_06420 [Cladophialophora immunda]|uniref:Uncharacterized protein n=1 Tax=Cladophialophora immunda TaxID=569365 RepID=A0A0D1ZFJ9_9EURO|nr:uncharacterized protein PV07_06420 [Cladophialophora immunda]KIW26601.1 hypothetical protein PV07_06420 [Cladophialophora immunda]OQV07379.1 hypothetical protein CLAIMM_11822 [Cladophialophora immunda]